MRPLERLPTIRAKLGSVIVFAVALTLLLVFVFVAFALRNSPRDSEVLALLDAARKAANGKLQEIPPNTMVVFRSVEGGVVIKGRDLKTDPPVFDDEQAHWGIVNGLEYVAVPRVNDGFVVGTDYVMRPAPDLGLAGSFDATLGFLQQQWWQLLVAGVIAALFSLLAARILALGMTQPLRDMVRAAKKMAVGDYSARIDTRSVDEVGQLADAFNRMSSELASVEQLRRDLVGNVSHELKTPITALRAHLENVQDGVEKPDPETLAIMLQQSDRLSALVDQLLELSRMESGDLPLDLVPMSLAPLAQAVVSEVEIARGGGGAVVRNEVPEDLDLVLADPARIHQVLFNLLDNAMRFSESGGEVVVAAAPSESFGSEGRCEVSVSDTGPGIAEEHLPRVFERFYRVDPARSRERGGTGIGLAIAKSIVQAHGGVIRVSSEEGRGSTFMFDLAFADGRKK